MVLSIYAHFNSRPGEALRSNNFIAVAARQRIRIDDLQAGLDYAAEMGWVEETENGYLKLTDKGFEMMQ